MFRSACLCREVTEGVAHVNKPLRINCASPEKPPAHNLEARVCANELVGLCPVDHCLQLGDLRRVFRAHGLLQLALPRARQVLPRGTSVVSIGREHRASPTDTVNVPVTGSANSLGAPRPLETLPTARASTYSTRDAVQ